jgi:drug/metabolite transporter (DMT)-like permease
MGRDSLTPHISRKATRLRFNALLTARQLFLGAVFFYNAGMMLARWLPYALACSICLATADFFVKLASSKISTSLGMFIYGATTFVVGFAWVSYLKITGKPLFVTQIGLLYSLAVGIAFSAVTLLLYLALAQVSVSLGSPTIRLLGIVIASLLGILVLHEPFTWRYALGVLLTIAGVTLIILR